jgi:hypothetical protein
MMACGTESPMGFAANTIWIYQKGKHDWRAVFDNGNEFAHGKFGSTLEAIVRKRISDEGLDIFAVAMVVNPAKRQPNRRIPITRPMRDAGILPYNKRSCR